MHDLSFTHPEWLWLLLLAPVLILGKLVSDHLGRRAVEGFIAPRLRQQLVIGQSALRSWLIFSLQIMALSLIIAALCGPRWGEENLPEKEGGRDILLAIDTSRSMLADDIRPDRLTHAKLAAQDLLALLPGDRVGLIAFAGNAFLQAPLTTDHQAVLESIQALDIFSIPRGGSELGTALALAVETFSKSPASNHGLVIFSDGGEADVELEKAIEQAIASQILVLTIGVGTDTGSLIPDPDPQRPGDWVRDANGNVVKTRLESGPLKEVAHRTRGHYLKLDSRTLDERLIRQVLAVLDRHQTETKTSTKPIERYQWPLSAGLLLLLLAWMLRPSNAPAHTPTRRPASAPALLGISLGVSLGIGLSAPEAQAKWWHDVTHSTRSEASAAATALDSGHSEDALKRYEALLEKDPPSEQRPAIEIGLGTAAYRLEDYDRAVAAFSRALAAQDTTTRLSAHQGLAHSLYDQGDRNLAKMPQFTLKAWRDSLRHFKAALTADPANEALRENRDFVQDRLDRLIEEILKQQQQQRQQGQGQKGQKGQQGQEGEEGEEGQQGQNGQQGKQGQQGQGGEEGDDPNGRKGKNGKDGEDGSGGQTAKGQPGEGQQEREAQQLPEGQITAGTEGAPDPNSDSQNAMKFSDGDRRQETGFSENEARTFLRIYADDQKSARMNQQRHNAARGKDW